MPIVIMTLTPLSCLPTVSGWSNGFAFILGFQAPLWTICTWSLSFVDPIPLHIIIASSYGAIVYGMLSSRKYSIHNSSSFRCFFGSFSTMSSVNSWLIFALPRLLWFERSHIWGSLKCCCRRTLGNHRCHIHRRSAWVGWVLFRVLLLSVFSYVIVTYICHSIITAINVALAFCMGTDLQAIIDSPQPMAQIFLNSFGQKGALAIWAIIVVVQYMMGSSMVSLACVWLHLWWPAISYWRGIIFVLSGSRSLTPVVRIC